MTCDSDKNSAYGTWIYDAPNRLVAVGGTGSIPSLGYAYDALGNRIALTNGGVVTRFVINPNAPLSQVLIRIRPGVTNYYVYGVGLLYEVTETATNSYQRYYHYDYRGSTVALTDNSGNVTDRFEYSAYGTLTYRTGTTDTPFLFNGRYGVQTDPNGLLYMRARYYNPYICRFINPDPIGFSGGLNWYAYADGNPVSYLDPFGLWSWSQTLGVVRAVGGVFETAAGVGLAAATSWSGIGAVAGGAVALHGLDQIQAGVRQAWTGDQVDSLTSSGLQAAGVSRTAANLTDAAISIVGSFGAGTATATIRASQIAAADPLAQGLTTCQILARYERGSRALNAADYWGLGGDFTSPLYKAAQMETGAYPLTTTFGERTLQSVRLFLGLEGTAGMGLTPLGYLWSGYFGAAGGGISGVGTILNSTRTASSLK
ncbi:MAG: RHS repeat-associated core domain-containing protein [Verrucomicrobiae bacterium]|nr:RHS repeat-associated core domain-containing protein [Verrucomicrobiae bacterium]